VVDSRGTGLYFFEGNDSSFQHVQAFRNRSHGAYISGPSWTIPDNNASWFGLLDALWNGGDGVHIKNCFQNAFDQVVVRYNSGDGLVIDSDWHSLLNLYAEDNGGAGLRFGSNANYVLVHQISGGDNIVDNSYGNASAAGFTTDAEMKHSRIRVGSMVFCDYAMNETFEGQMTFDKNVDGNYYLTQSGSSADRKLILTGGTGLNLETTELGLDNKDIKYGSAAPTTGTYTAGDIVFDSSPTAGSYVGWICVTGGSPGTWKRF
jgi:hypothetical protein